MTPITPKLIITGFSGSGKTTLIEQMIPVFLQNDYLPGYIKHAGHLHQFDVEGKDTYRQFKAGSLFSAIYSEDSWFFQTRAPFDENILHQSFLFDLLLLEGFKTFPGSKIVCVHPEKGIPDRCLWQKPPLSSDIIAYYTPTSEQAEKINQNLNKKIAYSRFDSMKEFVFDITKSLQHSLKEKNQLSAAIFIGGKSRRMGSDKMWIDYGQGPHAFYLFDLLQQHPDLHNVFYSGSNPSNLPEEKFEFLVKDRFPDSGPMGGLLSLFSSNSQNAWLIAGCDLSCLGREVVDYLIEHRNPLKNATIPIHENGQLEPLFAIYEPSIFPKIKNAFIEGHLSLHRLLKTLPVEKVLIPEALKIQFSNANTPEELESSRKYWRHFQ